MLKAAIAPLLLALAITGPAQANDRNDRIIDGSTVHVAGETYQLRHIRVPRPGDMCRRGNQSLDCGLIAKAQLIDITVGSAIQCDRQATGDRCRAGGYDLSYGMVHAGWARARHASLRSVEAKARKARRGLWHPDYQPPATWRD
mgnify:CR=1 FL=1